jgi:hypothetical protein
MTMVLPCRLITRHRSHMGFTDGLTFISAIPVCNSAAREVVRRQLNLHLVAREDPDVVLPHLPRDRRENAVASFDFDAEHRIRQGLGDLALDLDLVLLLDQIPFNSIARKTRTRLPASCGRIMVAKVVWPVTSPGAESRAPSQEAAIDRRQGVSLDAGERGLWRRVIASQKAWLTLPVRPLGCSLRVRIFGPSAVTATVCSKWAESDRSSVEIDHSSS